MAPEKMTESQAATAAGVAPTRPPDAPGCAAVGRAVVGDSGIIAARETVVGAGMGVAGEVMMRSFR